MLLASIEIEALDTGPFPEHPAGAIPVRAGWHVLWTRSNFEQPVRDQLVSRGFAPFLPMVSTWSRRGGARRRVEVPLFPGYLFLHGSLDKARHTEVRKARGLVRILGERWDRPATVPEHEIEAIRAVVDSRLPAARHPYLREGRRARIAAGPLAGIEGILVKDRADKGLLVLSVNLLQRSVAVEVDCRHVDPI